MRNPNRSVKMVPGLRVAGNRARQAFDQLREEHPNVLLAADNFGAPGYTAPSTTLVHRYRELLRHAFDVKAELTPVSDEGQPSPLQASLLQAWFNAARDPEVSMKSWIREGVTPPPSASTERSTQTPSSRTTRDRRRLGLRHVSTKYWHKARKLHVRTGQPYRR